MPPTKLVNIVPLVRPKSPHRRPSPYDWEPCVDVRLAPQSRKQTLDQEAEKYRTMGEPSFVSSQARLNGYGALPTSGANRSVAQQRAPLSPSHASNSYYGSYFAPSSPPPHAQFSPYSTHNRPRRKTVDPEYFAQNREICELLMKEFPHGPPPGMEQQQQPEYNPQSWTSMGELESLEALLLPETMDFSIDQSMMSSPINEDVDLDDVSGLIDQADLREFASSIEQDWRRLQEEGMSQSLS